MEQRHGKDIILPVALSTVGILALGYLSTFAFTKAQRTHIIDRDGGVCQFPEKHTCCGSAEKPVEDRKLQVHHIIPQRYSEAVGIENPDIEENGITLCKNAHVGASGVHPDIAGAHSKDDFKRVFENREKKLAERKLYWNDTWDRIFHVIALRNTQRFATSGRVFPQRKKRG